MSNMLHQSFKEEGLGYIGGYIVKTFCVEYPQLGGKNTNESMTTNKTWIDHIHRGGREGLHVPSESYYSQLRVTTMRKVFQTVHGHSLKEGKDCFKRIVSEIERVGLIYQLIS